MSTVWVCPLMDCCDGEAPHNKVQVAFPVCCGTPIERNQVMHPQQSAVSAGRGVHVNSSTEQSSEACAFLWVSFLMLF